MGLRDDAVTTFDVLTIGRIGVDLYPLLAGVPLAEVDTFGRFLGGSRQQLPVTASCPDPPEARWWGVTGRGAGDP
jgi:hypothetical protein